MTDILIHDVPDEVIAAYEAEALKREVTANDVIVKNITDMAPRQHQFSGKPITEGDWERFAALTKDLSDPEIMAGAWR